MKKNENGITLVSLVITIIVLLIITAVTVNELEDDELVDQVENETKEQQKLIDEEQNKMDKVKNEQLQDWGF